MKASIDTHMYVKAFLYMHVFKYTNQAHLHTS